MVLQLLLAAIVSFAGIAQSASPGCGKSHFFRGITTYHDLESNGKTRAYSVHLPSNYSATAQYPVVLGFHGSDGVGFFFEADTGLSSSRYSANKILVYPNGVDGFWAGANYSKVSTAEDLQFVGDLLDKLSAEYCVDENRIYATGISNGGGFVNVIACSPVGGRFAAFAPVAGAFYTDLDGSTCNPARSPLPILDFHGGNDKSVFYGGGEGQGGVLPAIPTWLGYWAARNGCTSSKKNDTANGQVHHISWTCNGTPGLLQHYKVDTMGHVWPSTEINFSQIAAGEGPTHIKASQLLINFFDQFTRP